MYKPDNEAQQSAPPIADTSKPQDQVYPAQVTKTKKFFKELTHQCNICHKRVSGEFKLKKHFKKAHGMQLVS